MKLTCIVPGCTGPTVNRTPLECDYHYRERRKGKPYSVRRRKDIPLEERVDAVGWTETSNGCWEWNGFRDNVNYGRIKYKQRPVKLHRFMYERYKGPIPKGLVVRHKCDNPPCSNPEHLEVGTHQENMNDMWDRNPPRRLRNDEHPRSKVGFQNAERMRTLGRFGFNNAEIARVFEVSWNTASDIVEGRRWVKD